MSVPHVMIDAAAWIVARDFGYPSRADVPEEEWSAIEGQTREMLGVALAAAPTEPAAWAAFSADGDAVTLDPVKARSWMTRGLGVSPLWGHPPVPDGETARPAEATDAQLEAAIVAAYPYGIERWNAQTDRQRENFRNAEGPLLKKALDAALSVGDTTGSVGSCPYCGWSFNTPGADLVDALLPAEGPRRADLIEAMTRAVADQAWECVPDRDRFAVQERAVRAYDALRPARRRRRWAEGHPCGSGSPGPARERGERMRVASVCSSVGGLDLGLHRAGHETVAFCELDPWRREVLARHWPGVPIHTDLTRLHADQLPACDLLVGGTPCQDLSNAGRQAGLDGERSGLFWAFAQLRIDLYERHGCAWSLWENVAGSLSSNKGRDFAQVLAAHVGAEVAVPRRGWAKQGGGHAVGPWGTAEWRLLDAQFFGVPQRRRRVFVVGHLGADVPSEVLADGPRVPRHPEARRAARPNAPRRPGGCVASGCVTSPVTHALTARGHDASEDGSGRGAPIVAERRITGTLTARDRKGPDSDGHADRLIVSALDYPAVRTELGVRRLTPTERERLMGWPDGWTYAHGPSLLDAPQSVPTADSCPVDLRPDGRRESATGDGVVAHVAEWIGLGFLARHGGNDDEGE